MKFAAPIGLKPPPRRAPKKLSSAEDLRTLQRLMTHALALPLTKNNKMQPRWRDGRSMAKFAAEFIKPNDRLTSLERLQIYARCYWFRIVDGVYEDCPAVRALLGEKKFSALANAYLAKYPSHSWTMRNLCARLAQFIREEPRWTAPDTALAEAVARFEWAQTVAFDTGARPVLTRDDIADAPPARLRIGLQPYLTLFALDWPIDDYVIALKDRESLRSDASNTVDRGPHARKLKHVPRPPRRPAWIVVHRYQNRLYYKRVTAAGFKILTALGAGKTLAQAVAAAGPKVKPEQVRDWFAGWMELGWFCKR